MFTEQQIKEKLEDNDVVDFLMGLRQCDFCSNHTYFALVKMWGQCPKCKRKYPKQETKK